MYFDYKDTETLAQFLDPHARIQKSRRTKLSQKEQRALGLAIKRARFMGLLPYIAR